jgi:hypothetical protein
VVVTVTVPLEVVTVVMVFLQLLEVLLAAVVEQVVISVRVAVVQERTVVVVVVRQVGKVVVWGHTVVLTQVVEQAVAQQAIETVAQA